MIHNLKESLIALSGVVAITTLTVSVLTRNAILSSVSSFGLAGTVTLATASNSSDKRRQLEQDLRTSQASVQRLTSDLSVAHQDASKLSDRLRQGAEGFTRLEAIVKDLQDRLETSGKTIESLESTVREQALSNRVLSADIEALTAEKDMLKGQSESQRSEWITKYDQMISDYETQIEGLKATLSEYEKELYRFRDSNGLVLEVERGKIALEVKALQDRLNELESLNGSMKSHVMKGREVIQELESEFSFLTDTAYPEIAQLHEVQLNERDKLLMQLSGQVAEMKKPQVFDQIGEYQRADKLIEFLYQEHGIVLDASEIEPLDEGAFTCYLNIRDRKARGVAFIEALNGLSDALMVQLAAVNPVTFTFDSLNPHRVKAVIRYRRKTVTQKDITNLWKSAEQFISVVSKWKRVRVTGGSESGKTPFSELLVGAWQRSGRSMNVYFAFPLSGSRKNFSSVPVTHSTVTSAVRDALRELGRKQETNHVYILDEVDTALSDNGKGLASDIKELFKTGSHYDLGLVLLGQNANVRQWSGLDRSDFENLVNVHIGANAYHAIANSNLSEDEQKDLKSKADKLTAYCESVNKDLDSEADSDKLCRFALVLEPGKRGYYIELPRFGSLPYIQTQTAETEKQTALSVESSLTCPVCSSDKLRKNGKTRKNEQRYRCVNGHSFTEKQENV